MMRRRPGQSIYRFTVATYSNRKGEPRAQVIGSEGDFRAVARGEDSAIGALVEALGSALWESTQLVAQARATAEVLGDDR